MVRRFLTLLAVVPLLLPQGICVCDLLAPCAACEQPASTPSAPASACCCECCQAEPVVVDGAGLAALHSCQSSPADRDEHLPACPAEGSAQWKADLGHGLPTIGLDVVGSVSTIDTPAVSMLLAPAAQLDTAERPLYLTLLTLRI